MPEFLLEIETDEVPSALRQRAVSGLSRMAQENLHCQGARVLHSPRRLALIASDPSQDGVNAADLTTELRELAASSSLIPYVRHLACLYGDQVIAVRSANAVASGTSHAHWRTHGEEEIELASAASYERALAEKGIIVDQGVRLRMVREAIDAASRDAGIDVDVEDDLLAAISGGVEYPQQIAGRVNIPIDLPIPFARAALRAEELVLIARESGVPATFVGFSDGKVDPDAVRANYERVAGSAIRRCQGLFSRDRAAPLADSVRKLRDLMDEQGLSSLWEKTERLRTLSGVIAPIIGANQGMVDRAAFLSQADRATWIVRKFPSLHGSAGANYAALDGEEEGICHALEGRGREGAALAIAEKFDDLCSVLLEGKDGRDPAVVDLADDLIEKLTSARIDLDLLSLLRAVSEQYRLLASSMGSDDLEGRVAECLSERLAQHLVNELGVTSAIAAAVPREVRGNPYRGSACAAALKKMSEGERFSLLLGSYGRMTALLTAPSDPDFDPALFQGDAERSLWREYLKAEGKLDTYLEEIDYELAIGQLFQLAEAIDRYAEDVDPKSGSSEVKRNRLGLVACVVGQFARVCDLDALLAVDERSPGKKRRDGI